MSRESNDAFDAWAKRKGYRPGTWNYIRTAEAWQEATAFAAQEPQGEAQQPDKQAGDAPVRACRFALDLQADTRQDLANALYNMASQIERGEMTRGVSGGYSSGYIYELAENAGPTHDEWAQQLRTYLDAKKASGTGASKEVNDE